MPIFLPKGLVNTKQTLQKLSFTVLFWTKIILGHSLLGSPWYESL